MPKLNPKLAEMKRQFEQKQAEEQRAAAVTEAPVEEVSTEPIEPVQEAPTHLEPATEEIPSQVSEASQTQQFNQQPAQPNISDLNAYQVLNLESPERYCNGKIVQFQNYTQYIILSDSNYYQWLCYQDPTTGQYKSFASIHYENGFYYVCQPDQFNNLQAVGTLSYNSLTDPIWYFVPVGMNPPQQRQTTQPQPKVSNACMPEYTLNNVPSEIADQVVKSLAENNPQCNININFAPPTLEQSNTSSQEIIDIDPV